MTKPKPLPEIRKCPFGCDKGEQLILEDWGGEDAFQVCCYECGHCGPWHPTEEEAINAWNSLTREKGR